MRYRDYDPAHDFDTIKRLWHETGWTNQDSEAEQEGLRAFMDMGPTIVSEVHGRIECQVGTTPGQIMHGDTPIDISLVSAVITGMPARKLGLAGRLTAMAVARAAEEGAMASILGMFEQGFYDRLGFGTGPYETFFRLDPSQITFPAAKRAPHRLTAKDYAAMHESRMRRMGLHGRVYIKSPGFTHYEAAAADNGFGLGYYDGPKGSLSHHIWFSTSELEHGPLWVQWMTYETWDQFCELMGVIKNLGDQYYVVIMPEPAGVQLQDVVHRPITAWNASEGKHGRRTQALAYYQLRMNDIAGCLAQTRAEGDPYTFNLRLRDPITNHLHRDASWRGTAGEYIVTLGDPCGATLGSRPELPTLTADINSFSRLWLGVRPATGLAITANLEGPPELLKRLDRAFRTAKPLADWVF